MCITGRAERALLVAQMARFFYIYIYILNFRWYVSLLRMRYVHVIWFKGHLIKLLAPLAHNA